MGIQELIFELGRWFLSLGIVATLLGYLGKKLLDALLARDIEQVRKELTKDVESHKAQLALDSAKEIESLKSQLHIEAHRQSVGYASLHAKRAEIIAQAYALLAGLNHRSDQLLRQPDRRGTPGLTQQDIEKDVLSYPLTKYERDLCQAIEMDYKEFREFFRTNKIFLPRDVAAKTEHIAFSFFVLSDHYAYTGAWFEADDPQVVREIKGTLESMSSRISELLPLVEDEFRSLLIGER